MKLHALRLRPGADLREGLEDYLNRKGIEAAALVSCVGSLRVASLRLASAPQPCMLTGPFEIVSSEGTLSIHGCHLHMAVADSDGKLSGGHLAYGSLVRTTAELVLVELPGFTFHRETDSETGYQELVINESAADGDDNK
jgi:predicted DNA-binding protein with PD1-like motif